MTTFCLTEEIKDKFKIALVNREIDPSNLIKMESLERRNFLEKYVGKENSTQVNSLFESKLLLKNQKAGYISWAKKIAGISEETRRDILSKIERLDKALSPSDEKMFLHDLIQTRLGVDIKPEEAKVINSISKKLTDLRSKANKEGIFSNESDRLSYGSHKVALEKYMNDLKLKGKKVNLITESPGILKSIVTSMDNSFWGRQGIKVLLNTRTSGIWFKNFLKSWGDIGKELKGEDAMDSIRADIYSRPNALNGKYKVGGYQLDVLSEEAYPSSFPEKIPLLGRLFKASESAYNGAALRLRADLADRYIKIAEKQGINTLDPAEARGMGNLIGSMTGRGKLPLTAGQSKFANVMFFSVKFLKSNFDTLTVHFFDPKASKFVKMEAAKNLLNIAATTASILTVAKILNKNSVDEDPRSTNFGKVKVFGHWMDITGGMAGLITLASRLLPTYHNGQLSLWSKSSSGNYTDLLAGKYGQQNPLDVFENFWQGKLSPIAGLLRDIWKGKNYQGQPITFKNELSNIGVPMSISNYSQFKSDPNSSFILGSMIIDALGFSTSTYTYKKDWDTSSAQKYIQFKSKVGDEKFGQANEEFNKSYSLWYNRISQTDGFNRLSDSGKDRLTTQAKDKLEQNIFKKYGFIYKEPRKTLQQKQEEKQIKKLTP